MAFDVTVALAVGALVVLHPSYLYHDIDLSSTSTVRARLLSLTRLPFNAPICRSCSHPSENVSRTRSRAAPPARICAGCCDSMLAICSRSQGPLCRIACENSLTKPSADELTRWSNSRTERFQCPSLHHFRRCQRRPASFRPVSALAGSAVLLRTLFKLSFVTRVSDSAEFFIAFLNFVSSWSAFVPRTMDGTLGLPVFSHTFVSFNLDDD